MKTHLFLIALLFSATLHAADLPTITVEHLYYLQARADRVRKFKPDDMILKAVMEVTADYEDYADYADGEDFGITCRVAR